jgi:hypothetical protein
MAEEKRLDIQVDVQIINKKSNQSAKKNSRDQGIQQNLEKLHSRKNYHDSRMGSSKLIPLWALHPAQLLKVGKKWPMKLWIL